eukprot:scaffold76261_cov33-Tisochrysis_lutea.AAC.6
MVGRAKPALGTSAPERPRQSSKSSGRRRIDATAPPTHVSLPPRRSLPPEPSPPSWLLPARGGGGGVRE